MARRILEWGARSSIAVWVCAALLALAVGLPASADGSAVYMQQCGRCHGPDGAGDTPVGKAMKVPKLTGLDKAKVVATVRGNPKHKAVSAKLSEQEMAVVATKVAGF